MPLDQMVLDTISISNLLFAFFRNIIIILDNIYITRFGKPEGTYGSFRKGSSLWWHNALSILQKECVGKESCSIDGKFGSTNCGDILKWLAMDAISHSFFLFKIREINIVWKDGGFNSIFMAQWTIKLLPVDAWKLMWTEPSIRNRSRRDWSGGCDEYGQYIPFALSAFHIEAEACWAGLLVAIHQGWVVVDLESDCATIITALEGMRKDHSEIGQVVEDCKDYLSNFLYLFFTYLSWSKWCGS